eukprot:209785-Rhodomonas_salina.1
MGGERREESGEEYSQPASCSSLRAPLPPPVPIWRSGANLAPGTDLARETCGKCGTDLARGGTSWR